MQQQEQKKKRVYHCASLFNLREVGLNAILNEKLEKAGYDTYTAQRDGFEFSQFTDEQFDEIFTNEKEKQFAQQWIIYLLVLGKFVWESDVILANLDEPVDPGVIVEMMFAHQMGKPVVGYRTESRSPFGALDDFSNGMHFFLYMICDSFLTIPPTKIGSIGQLNNQCEVIVSDIQVAIERGIQKYQEKQICGSQLQCEVQAIRDMSNELFKGLDQPNKRENLNTIFSRYQLIKDKLQQLQPLVSQGQRVHPVKDLKL